MLPPRRAPRAVVLPGDETSGGYSRSSTFQTNKTREANKTKTNKWFERKIRSAEERADAAAMNEVRREKENVVERLRRRREARRAGLSREDAAGGGCCVS